MLRNSIPGLDKLIESDPPKGTVIIVTGDAGTLKSSFVFYILAIYLFRHPDECGDYITVDENRDSLIRMVHSLGMKVPPNLTIQDIASFRTSMKRDFETGVDSGIYFSQAQHLMTMNIDSLKEKKGKKHDESKNELKPSCYALDSINGLLAIAPASQDGERQRSYESSLRKTIFEFLSVLRENNAVNFLIFETTGEQYRPEFFMADGIIELGTTKYKDDIKRYIQIKKMKGVKHKLERYLIDATPNGLEVMGKII